jgi:transposase InsO family protein
MKAGSVAIDRISRFAYAELHPRATRLIARDFLSGLLEVVPCAIHTILTDNGIQFAVRKATEGNWFIPSDRVCDAHGIEHRLTQVGHPWTNGQVERMNRPLKEATVKRDYDQMHEPLKAHLQTFRMAYNFARRLKTLKGLTTPYEFICKTWTKQPERFRINPIQHTVGLNN